MFFSMNSHLITVYSYCSSYCIHCIPHYKCDILSSTNIGTITYMHWLSIWSYYSVPRWAFCQVCVVLANCYEKIKCNFLKIINSVYYLECIVIYNSKAVVNHCWSTFWSSKMKICCVIRGLKICKYYKGIAVQNLILNNILSSKLS